jgi:hypothetical protein
MVRFRRFASVLLVATAVVAASACGGGGGGGAGGDLSATFKYLPPNAAGVLVVSTDVQGRQFKSLDSIVEARAHRTLESYFEDGASAIGLSYENDVKPLLGNELVIGGSAALTGILMGGGPDVVVAFHATSGSKLRDALDKATVFKKGEKVEGAQLYRLRGADESGIFALDGDVLVGAESESTLRAALARAHGGDHFDPARFDRALSGLPSDALVRAYGDISSVGVIPQLARLRAIPWFDALRTVAVALSFTHQKALLDLAANTKASRLEDRDLPLASGDASPQVLHRPGEIVSANRNQSLTTVFLYRVAEVAFPQSRFVEEAHALQKQLHIDFAQEVLRQFNGPSASAVSLDGKTFAARSDLSDPAALKQVLPKLAPHLPAIVTALQGLQSQGEALLFLFAPDVLVGQGNGVKVTPPSGPNGLWHVTGLTGEGPDQLYFGVLGNEFVVASDEASARRVAAEPTDAIPGAHGAAVARVDLSKVSQEQLDRASLGAIEPLGELVAWVRATRSQLHAHASLELP